MLLPGYLSYALRQIINTTRPQVFTADLHHKCSRSFGFVEFFQDCCRFFWRIFYSYRKRPSPAP